MNTETPQKVKAYLNSKENILLVPNRDFGNRKYFSVGMNKQMSLSKNKNNQGNIVNFTYICCLLKNEHFITLLY